MDSSPPSTPRSYSPLLDEDDLVASTSPLPSPVPSFAASAAHDLYTAPDSADAKLEAETEQHRDVRPNGTAHPPKDAGSRLLKGKEKARQAPLRLLDLPVDVLKEIIQQVSIPRTMGDSRETFESANPPLPVASPYQRPYLSRPLPFCPTPARYTIHLLSV